MILYLAGPMTGKPDFNSAEFAKYAEKYRGEGFTVISPPEMDGGDWTKPYETYIRRDVGVFINEKVDRVYLLPGWQESRGARLEKHLAEVLGIAIYDAETGAPFEENVAEEAQRLVYGDRRETYNNPLADFGRTAGIINAMMHHKLSEPLLPEDIALMMIAVKLSRLTNKPGHRDSLVDILGYGLCYEWVRKLQEDQGAKPTA